MKVLPAPAPILEGRLLAERQEATKGADEDGGIWEASEGETTE